MTEFIKHCPTCQLQQPKKAKPPLHPIIAQDFMERIQIDLIDMRHTPDGEFHYIGHFTDHMKKARDETYKAALSMSNYYNKTKCTTDDDYSEGDKVSVLVPKIDRCSTDMCRIPGFTDVT